MKNNNDQRIDILNTRLDKLEQDISFLKQLLTHLHDQFKDIKKK